MEETILYLFDKGFDISYKGTEFLAYILDKWTLEKIQNSTMTAIVEDTAKKYKTNVNNVNRLLRYTISRSKYKGLKLKRVIYELTFQYPSWKKEYDYWTKEIELREKEDK